MAALQFTGFFNLYLTDGETKVLRIIDAFTKVWLGCIEENMNAAFRVLQNYREFSRIGIKVFGKHGPSSSGYVGKSAWHCTALWGVLISLCFFHCCSFCATDRHSDTQLSSRWVFRDSTTISSPHLNSCKWYSSVSWIIHTAPITLQTPYKANDNCSQAFCP